MSHWPRLFGVGAVGARGVLSTTVGSMMSVMGVTFLMVLVTLASSQYTSCILRNFMCDRVTQIVLGISADVFTYFLVVLRIIRGAAESTPSLTVAFGVVLTNGGIGALIYFIHHITARSLYTCLRRFSGCGPGQEPCACRRRCKHCRCASGLTSPREVKPVPAR